MTIHLLQFRWTGKRGVRILRCWRSFTLSLSVGSGTREFVAECIPLSHAVRAMRSLVNSDLYIRKDSCTPSRAVKWHEFSLVHDMCGSVGVLVGLEATRFLSATECLLLINSQHHLTDLCHDFLCEEFQDLE